MTEFKNAMQAAGITPPENIIADGNIHRFHIKGDKYGTTNGWYILFNNPLAGVFGCWKRDIKENWSSKNISSYTPEEKIRYNTNMDTAKKQREAEQAIIHADCRKRSANIWQQAKPATADHPYLINKGIKSYGLKAYKGSLAIQLVDSKGTIHGLQFIDKTGSKRFLTGTAKRGHYFSIGGNPKTVLYLAEGYATAATIYEATGEPVAVCFDAGNLKPVAESFRMRFPDLKLVICADNDRYTEGNPGLTKAIEAAQAVGGIVSLPEFPEGAKGSDFNDLCAAIGIDKTKQAIETNHEPQTLATLAGLATDKEPLPLRRELPKSESFPLNALPSVLSEFAYKIMETIQPPAALVGQSLLAASSLAVQPLANISIDGRIFPLSGFFLTVGESGERKTAVDNAVLAPHRKHERMLIDLAQAAILDYQARHEAWDEQRIKAKKSKGDIRQALLDIGNEPIPPLEGQYITEEPTYEGIFKLLHHGQPSIGIFSAEGGRFVGGNAMNKDNQLKTATGLSSLWDGSPMTRTRSGDGNNTLYGRRCSLHLMLQPNIASELLSNNLLSGQGLLSRCLTTYPQSTIGNRMYKAININETPEGKLYFSSMEELLASDKPLAEGLRNELNPRELTLSAKAKQDWVQFHDHIEKLMQPGKELSHIKGFASKAAENAARLSGILTLIENPAAVTISQESIQAGIKLSQFYIGEALRLFHASNDDQDLILAEECLTWAANQNKSQFSLPCLYQSGPNRVRDKKTATRIISILTDHNLIEIMPGGATINNKKRREAWQVVA